MSAEEVVLPTIEYNTAFSGASLNIGKDLSVRYHITISDGENINDFAVRFTMNDYTVEVSDYVLDTTPGKYVFSFCGVAPQCMGDTIYAELLKNGKLVDENKYSVKAYVQDALALYSDYTELTQLLSDLLLYGAAAQEYVGYRTNALVTKGMDLPNASSATPDAGDKNKSVTSADGDTQFTAAGVRFDYNNRIYVKFKAPSIDGISVFANGEALEIQKSGSVYIAYTDGISALNFGDVVTFTLSSDGEVIQTLTYTVNDYALDKYGDAQIGDLALALYRYGKSAISYNNTLGGN